MTTCATFSKPTIAPLAARKGDTENIHIQTFGAHSLHAFTTRRRNDSTPWLGRCARPAAGERRQQLAYALDFEGRLPAQDSAEAEAVAARRVHDRIGRRQSERQHVTGPSSRCCRRRAPYARFPFFNMMNTEDGFGALILRPHQRSRYRANFTRCVSAARNDLWYSGGGVYQPWTFGYTGRSTSGQTVAGESVRHERRIPRQSQGHVDRLLRLHARPRRDGADLSAAARTARFGYLEALLRF